MHWRYGTRALLLVRTLSVIDIYKNCNYSKVKHVGITELHSVRILYLANI